MMKSFINSNNKLCVLCIAMCRLHYECSKLELIDILISEKDVKSKRLEFNVMSIHSAWKRQTAVQTTAEMSPFLPNVFLVPVFI